MNDIGAAFDKLDRLLAAAQEAGPSIALLMELGRQQGLGDQTVQKYLRLNTTVLRWALKAEHRCHRRSEMSLWM
jgi:hypothetical protein